jgi:16S rRNA (guanine1207-N2)-methyltransferase
VHVPKTRNQGSLFTAVDNNISAVAACKKNFAHYGIVGEVQEGDLSELSASSFDSLICNPPFHQGFRVSGDLADHFLSATSRTLKPGAPAWFVVNQFIPLGRKAENYFSSQQELSAADGFKVYQLIRRLLRAH